MIICKFLILKQDKKIFQVVYLNNTTLFFKYYPYKKNILKNYSTIISYILNIQIFLMLNN